MKKQREQSPINTANDNDMIAKKLRQPYLVIDRRVFEKTYLTEVQKDNIKKLGVKAKTEKEALKLLRKQKITKRFKLTDLSRPRFECVVKPLRIKETI